MSNQMKKEKTEIEQDGVTMMRNHIREKKLRFNLGCSPIDKKRKELTFKLRQSLGGCPNDEKTNKQAISIDRTQDIVQVMRNQRNKH